MNLRHRDRHLGGPLAAGHRQCRRPKGMGKDIDIALLDLRRRDIRLVLSIENGAPGTGSPFSSVTVTESAPTSPTFTTSDAGLTTRADDGSTTTASTSAAMSPLVAVIVACRAGPGR